MNDKFWSTFHRVLGIESDRQCVHVDELEEWDSLWRVELIFELEAAFGLDVTPESLPENVTQQALRLWREGASREALSLLYRASLSRLIDRYELAFRSSHTEAECAALVRAHGIESLSEYFWELTQTWRRLAYGHQLPSEGDLQALCEGWNRELSSGD